MNSLKSAFSSLPIEHPLAITVNEDTPASLIKLQIVNLENLYLRERGGQVSYSFNNFELVVIPDKIEFQKGESITGRMGLMGYADQNEATYENEWKRNRGQGRFGIFLSCPVRSKRRTKELKGRNHFSGYNLHEFSKIEIRTAGHNTGR